jgi:glutamyl-Q tRNA(Asp) synthetase
LRTHDTPIGFDDALQGRIEQRLETAVGDFVLRRADGIVAYQLAVVVDDMDQGISHVVRGADLLESTPRQLHLQRLLGAPEPRYAHVPLAVNAQGEKLSKQTGARPLDLADPRAELARARRFLGQGEEGWALERVPRKRVSAAAV